MEVTTINFLGIAFIIVMGVLTLILPKRLALAPFIITAFYMTLGQQFVIFSLNFSIMRLMLFFGWLRIILRGEFSAISLNTIDRLIIWWVVISICTYTLLWQTQASFINRMGLAYNAIGCYFLFRFLINDIEDITRVVKMTAIIIAPLAILILLEKATGRNLFSIFGGVSEFTLVRDGRLRCQGPFRHPILAGTVGATLTPLFIGLWFKETKTKLVSAIGCVSATVLTIASASSGPALAYLSGIIGLIMWPLRKHMRLIRWAILFALISLHITMKAPVWYLISRISELIGGSGWHRSYLIDQAISHINEWWLLGTKFTAHWMPYTLTNNPGSADITNQYIYEAVNGGLLTMALFIAIIVICFRDIGRAISSVSDNDPSKILIWSMGVSLVAHASSFISVTYFDQMTIFWYLLLAIISSTSIQFNNSQPSPSSQL